MYSYQNNHWLTCYLFSFTAAVFFFPLQKSAAQETHFEHLFVTENTSLFEFSGSNVRNDALKASLDTFKLQWNCVILPSGGSDLESHRGIISPLWIFKGHGSFHSSSLASEKRTWADGLLRILFSYLWASMAHFQRCPWKCVERQAPQHGKTYNTLLLMPLVPLNMQTGDNGIHRTVGTDFLAHLWNAHSASHCALC